MRRLSLLLGFYLLLLTTPAAAQDDPPAPQFLYRDENKLVLLNGYTGEATELPFEVTERDYFAWSPDGQYLLARLKDTENIGYCLNLYDVDGQTWLYDEPISCAVHYSTFTADSTRIIYSSIAENNGILWLYNLTDEKIQELYRTTSGDEFRPASISDIQLSPTETYLTFVSSYTVMGGSLNYFFVMNIDSQDYFPVNETDPYYAFYRPIWSVDDRWVLIVLQEDYVTSGALAVTNHQGDVYLIKSETGEVYRITYTPAAAEYDIRWTDDGRIAFTEVIEKKFTFTTEQAMNVEQIPSDEIIWPDPVDAADYYNPLRGIMVSPDTNLGAWVSSKSTQADGSARELNIGSLLSIDRIADFSVPIAEADQYNNILIGWRPSDYSYPQG